MMLVIENVLVDAELQRFRDLLDRAAWEDGRTSAGSLARAAKNNRQLDEDAETAITLGNQILRILGAHPLFISAALPEKIYPPRFNRYEGGEHYGAHVDSAVMRMPGKQASMRADISATLFLSNPDDYEGGELTIEGPFGAQEVKLSAGDMVIYPANSLHQVRPVTRGVRTSAFFWVQSMVAEESRRTILFDLDQSIQSLRAGATVSEGEVLRLSAVYTNLLRMWANV